jgi:hypothetical protein
MITFNLKYFKERISHQLAFQIQFLVCGKKIHCTVLDEGASTHVMYCPCCRTLGSHTLNESPTTMKSFDSNSFQPYSLLKSFAMQLKGKFFLVYIEVVDAPLYYNLLLVHSYFYAIIVFTSSVFSILQFSHKGKIIIIDQLD